MVQISNPTTGTYRIGVSYANSGGAGAVEAFVRFFCAGQLARELGPVALLRGGTRPDAAFWKVADVTMTSTSFSLRELAAANGAPLVTTASIARSQR